MRGSRRVRHRGRRTSEPSQGAPHMPQSSTLARTDAADTADYAVVHRAIRRAGYALAVAAESVSVADQRRLRAFRRYWAGHAGEILAHHGIEDAVFFPALRERVPEVADVLDELDGEH